MSLIKILTVDDDINICQLLSLYLTKEGYQVDMANNGHEALSKIRLNAYNIVLLDIMMPEMDGFETLREIRSFTNVPVIMLSARGEAMDKITGLDYGADDYVTKPFEPQELISRIKAILRRSIPETEVLSDITIHNMQISISNFIVKLDDVKLVMPAMEIKLLYFLVTHPMKVFTRDQLLEQVWGSDYAGDSRTVDVHIKRIRERLGDNEKWRLLTVWGVGYKFEVD